jgi:ligand-binding SRPBCC domain-containing protein
MNLTIKTYVNGDWNLVRQGFSKDLFEKLSPPFPGVKILRFDGSSKGDLVALELNFLFFKQKWTSEIVEETSGEEDYWLFIDEGKELPFFLKTWSHVHVVRKSKSGSIISDSIRFSSGWLLIDCILWPLMLAQFLYRNQIYKKVFNT